MVSRARSIWSAYIHSHFSNARRSPGPLGAALSGCVGGGSPPRLAPTNYFPLQTCPFPPRLHLRPRSVPHITFGKRALALPQCNRIRGVVLIPTSATCLTHGGKLAWHAGNPRARGMHGPTRPALRSPSRTVRQCSRPHQRSCREDIRGCAGRCAEWVV